MLTATMLGAGSSDAAASDTGATTSRGPGRRRGGDGHMASERCGPVGLSLWTVSTSLFYTMSMHAHLFLPCRRRPERRRRSHALGRRHGLQCACRRASGAQAIRTRPLDSTNARTRWYGTRPSARNSMHASRRRVLCGSIVAQHRRSRPWDT